MPFMSFTLASPVQFGLSIDEFDGKEVDYVEFVKVPMRTVRGGLRWEVFSSVTKTFVLGEGEVEGGRSAGMRTTKTKAGASTTERVTRLEGGDGGVILVIAGV